MLLSAPRAALPAAAPSRTFISSMLRRITEKERRQQVLARWGAGQQQQQAQTPGPPVHGTSDAAPFFMIRSEYGDVDPSYAERLRISFRRFVSNNLHRWMRVMIFGAAYAGASWWFGEWLTPGALMGSSEGFMSSKNKKAAAVPKTRLSDVCGCDEAKAEVQEIVEYLKGADKFTKLGGKMPKGILLLGPPGTGKTLLARAVAGEANVPFFSATGSDFEEMFVGVGAKRMRELFAEAKKVKPAIVFLDEIDSVGGKRHAFDHPKTRMSLNQLLSELDGFEENSGVVVIAATNYAERLDPALLRPGRFDRHITVPLPDIKGRREILGLYAKKMKLAPDVDLGLVARSTAGMTGADLAQLLNTAALRASTLDKQAVTTAELEHARDKILMGVERKSGVNEESIRRHIAYYEGGRSLIASLTPAATPLHKVTILERGMGLGHTAQVRQADDDQTSETYTEMLAQLDTRMAGRASEELVYGADGVTSHAAKDLARAQELGRHMVTLLGFNASIGPVSHSNWSARAVSNAQKGDVDREVATLLQQSYERVREKLKKHEPELHRIADALLKHEVLDASQVKAVLEGAAV